MKVIVTVDQLVQEFGEDRRKLITLALKWLDEQEPKWNVQLDRREFVRDLIDRAADTPQATPGLL